MPCSTIEIASPIEVDAYIQRWVILNDDIYLLKQEENPPAWFEDIINDIINEMGLVTDINDLENRFNNFEEGYTEHFYDWLDGDRETLAYVETIYTTNATFNAGIQEIKGAYVSKNESGAFFDQLIGAWQTGAGGAWFNEKVSVVSNIAYSAARSASTLTATMQSQQSELSAIVGDIEVLQKQVDGKVETFTGYHSVVDSSGNLITTAIPYADWLAANTLAEHTGDTYVKLEPDINGKDKLIGMWNFVYDTVNNTYQWLLIDDTLAAQAYNAALEAGVLADGKINSYYQTYPPTAIEDPTMGEGDLWVDSDNQNKLYRYNGTNWIAVRDTDITASVDRLDEATVDINGTATAKSSLKVRADGAVTGYVASASNDPNYQGSIFKIFADRFQISGAEGTNFNQAPFSIDTVNNKIKFNGSVTFSNVTGTQDVVTNQTLVNTLNTKTTQINGNVLTTGTIYTNRIAANQVWANGMISSSEFVNNTTGYVGNTDVPGFFANGRAGSGSFNHPNIYGAYIRGGHIYGSTIEGSTIKVRDLVVLTDAGYETKSVLFLKPVAGNWGFQPYNSTTGIARLASLNDVQIVWYGQTSLQTTATSVVYLHECIFIKDFAHRSTYGYDQIEVAKYMNGVFVSSKIIINNIYDSLNNYANFNGMVFHIQNGYDNVLLTLEMNNIITGLSGTGNISFKARSLVSSGVWGSWEWVQPPSGRIYNI